MKCKVWGISLLLVLVLSCSIGCSDDNDSTDVKAEIEENLFNEAEEYNERYSFIEESSVEYIEENMTIQAEEISFTYNDFSATKYAKSSVNVRDLPNTDGDVIGGLSLNQEATVTGVCNETGWYRIDYNGVVGYVSNKYLVDEKTESAPVPQPEIVPEPQQQQSEPEPVIVPEPEPVPEPALAPSSSGGYAVNSKNGKIHIVGQCPATGTGDNAMESPRYFATYEEAEAYSIQYNPGQKKRNCGNCW